MSPGPTGIVQGRDAGLPTGLAAPGARAGYRLYRRRQAMELLSLLPRDALRPLYARARTWAVDRGVHESKDPMDSLLDFCETLLPLPPFEIWLEDVAKRPDAHADALAPAAGPDQEPAPVAVELRILHRDQDTWRAALNVARGPEGWRGHIAFHQGPGRSLRTADVFRGETAEEIRSRFRGFDDAALEAFLRSVRP